MASYTAYRAIRDYLDAQWTTTRITWGNDNLGEELVGPWVHADVTGSSYEQESMVESSDPVYTGTGELLRVNLMVRG